jgi:hypothetical protein
MKERLLKWGVPVLLAAILVVPGVLASAPGVAQAAAKGTTYNVVLQKPSPIVSLTSINGGVGVPEPAEQAGVTFQMVIGTKAAKDGSVPVTLIAKSFKSGVDKFPMVGGGGMADRTTVVLKDAVGKFYPNGGGAVDVSVVAGAKVNTTFSGNGAPGSMILPLTLVSVLTLESTGKVFMTTPTFQYMTTGQSSVVAKGSKTRLEGKSYPADDTTKLLPNPLVGKPIDLAAGTGTLVATQASFGNKNKTVGTVDLIGGLVWVMKITKQ